MLRFSLSLRRMKSYWILFGLAWMVNGTEASKSLTSCCSQTRFPACNLACRKLVSSPSSYTYKGAYRFPHASRRFADIVLSCPRSEVNFWGCLGLWQGTADFVEEAKEKYTKFQRHSDCCGFAKHVSCKLHCLTTADPADFDNESCGRSRELKLNECVAKSQVYRQCCSKADVPRCHQACVKYFRSPGSPVEWKVLLEDACGQSSPTYRCAVTESGYENAVHAFTQCCEKSLNSSCREICQKAFHTSSNLKDVFATLSQHCGKWNSREPMYACILQFADSSEGKNVAVSRAVISNEVDSLAVPAMPLKDQCCAFARSKACTAWCAATMANPALMGLWDVMYIKCIQDPKEAELSACMTDVLEPCTLGGYSELKFCQSINNRPLESFRRCDGFGDSAAKNLYDFWLQGTVNMFDYKLVFKDIRTCMPSMWKAMTCLVAVRPCSHSIQQMQVCRRDCVELLDACLDQSKMGSYVSTVRVCSLLLPNDNQSGCLSVKDYVDTPATKLTKSVSLPCNPNPCKLGEVCLVNRDCWETSTSSCTKYSCFAGCSVGGKSKLLVPIGGLAKLAYASSEGACFQVCECVVSISGSYPVTYFDKCKYFGCESSKRCQEHDLSWEDGAIFWRDCNMCTCADGEIICSKKTCDGNGRLKRHGFSDVSSPSSPCNCEGTYNPVCATNGVTYSNLCFARCNGVLDQHLFVGDCRTVDPCDPDPCADRGLMCVPRRGTCLASDNHCPQFKCSFRIARYFDEEEKCPEPRECQSSECKSGKMVCGLDGVTYKSRCDAENSGSGVDYEGSCAATHAPYDGAFKASRCSSIKCPRVLASNCRLVTPPGTCCPICGAYIRVLYSERDLERHQNFISHMPVTVKDIMVHVQRQIRVAECNTHGYLSVDGGLIIVFRAVGAELSEEHYRACAAEAQRLHSLINSRSALLSTNYYLSVFKASSLRSSDLPAMVGASSSTNCRGDQRKLASFTLLWTFIFTFLYRR